MLEPFGPNYPAAIPGVAKFRRAARLEMCNAVAYGEAVLAGIREMQRKELEREIAPWPARCASGTFHSDGEAILRAVRGKNKQQA
jgi:hypothetical protein